MRCTGGLVRILAAASAGLTLVACSAAGHQASGAHPASDGHPAAATRAVAATHPAAVEAVAAVTGGHPRYGNPRGVAVPPAARAVSTAHPSRVIGTGTPASCTSAAVIKAVARGGVITFSCGPSPVTITMTATAKVVNTHRRTVLDGGGKVTLSGGGKVRILYMNTCDPKQIWTTSSCWEQKWPQLVVQNLTFADAYSAIRQTKTSSYGGGAIFAQGGQLKVVNSGFINNRCYRSGPDLGGAAVRALGMWPGSPVYITSDTFRGGRCSNGGALSSIAARWDVFNSFFVNNKAIGWGQNPQQSGTAGGGSGGAIYTDGNSYSVLIDGTIMRDNTAREGGGAIFFVVDAGGGTLKIAYSRLHHNPSGQFENAPGIFDHVDGANVPPTNVHSTIN
jgi:hypothetical protein